MVKQVAICHCIYATVGKQAFHVLLEFFTTLKWLVQFIDHNLFIFCELIRICRVNSREVRVGEFVIHTINLDYILFKINLVEQKATLHIKLFATHDSGSLKFELNDTDSLVHFRNQQIGTTLRLWWSVNFWHKRHTFVVAIHIKCKGGERQHIDAIAVFKHTLVAITELTTHHIRYTAIVAGSCTHPQNIVVAPLNIKVVIVTQYIHYLMWERSTVEHITENVKHIDSKLLNQVTRRHDEIVGLLRGNDCAHNHIYIRLLVQVVWVLVQKFLNNVWEIRRQCLVYFRASVFRRNATTHFHQAINGDKIPVFQYRWVGIFRFHQMKFFARIINKCANFFLLTVTQCFVKDFLHFTLNRTRSIA